MPPSLKRLRTLVTTLTGVMIVGVITIIILLAMRLSVERQPILINPANFALPAGVGIVGYSVIDGHAVLVAQDGVIRIFDAQTGVLTQTITVD